MATQAEYALLRWMLAMYDPSNGSPSAAALPVATASAVSSTSHDTVVAPTLAITLVLATAATATLTPCRTAPTACASEPSDRSSDASTAHGSPGRRCFDAAFVECFGAEREHLETTQSALGAICRLSKSGRRALIATAPMSEVFAAVAGVVRTSRVGVSSPLAVI